MSPTLHFTGRRLDGRPVQEPVDELTFARAWRAGRDARSFVVLWGIRR